MFLEFLISLVFSSFILGAPIDDPRNGLTQYKSAFAGDFLSLGGGWKTFQFLGEGTYADTYFEFTLAPLQFAIIQVTDLYCPGDQFWVEDKGIPIMLTTYVPTFSCDTKTTDPNFALYNPGWSSGTSVILSPGYHNVTIKVHRSPFTGGAAAIRIIPI